MSNIPAGGRIAQLVRGKSTDQGSMGSLYVLGQRVCYMLELPWRGNAQQFSRIPAGVYVCMWQRSPRFGWCYHVTGVEGRGSILIHSGNWAGDSKLGFITNSHGCILPCKRVGRLRGQLAGLVSAPAVRAIAELFNKETFTLEVKDA